MIAIVLSSNSLIFLLLCSVYFKYLPKFLFLYLGFFVSRISIVLFLNLSWNYSHFHSLYSSFSIDSKIFIIAILNSFSINSNIWVISINWFLSLSHFFLVCVLILLVYWTLWIIRCKNTGFYYLPLRSFVYSTRHLIAWTHRGLIVHLRGGRVGGVERIYLTFAFSLRANPFVLKCSFIPKAWLFWDFNGEPKMVTKIFLIWWDFTSKCYLEELQLKSLFSSLRLLIRVLPMHIQSELSQYFELTYFLASHRGIELWSLTWQAGILITRQARIELTL